MVYDVVSRHLAIEKIVVRKGPEGFEKKYYRFRPARWYDGISSADCVGCGLLCKFCWVSDKVIAKPLSIGEFYSGSAVACKLLSIARRYGYNQLRITGGEPTIGFEHLIDVLEVLKSQDIFFILETNGVLLGYDESYSKLLSKYRFIHVRVSLKGCSEAEFSMLTDASPEGFKLQLRSLENLINAGVNCHPAAMVSFSSLESIKTLLSRLSEIDRKLAEEFEVEELILYPHVKTRLMKEKLRYRTAYFPDSVPREQI